jgi:excisionase family DNA binding protein
VAGEDGKLLTTGEVAKRLGVSGAAVLKWMAQGLITPEFTSPGGHHRWILEDVREQLRAARKRDE